jgi:hypothetical protein
VVSFRGGPQRQRDRWFGLGDRPDFKIFKDWWHREGKDAHGGLDVPTRADAERIYQEWVELGKPKVK